MSELGQCVLPCPLHTIIGRPAHPRHNQFWHGKNQAVMLRTKQTFVNISHPWLKRCPIAAPADQGAPMHPVNSAPTVKVKEKKRDREAGSPHP